MDRYYNLLKEWCDRLIANQITELKDKNFYGGILCPACSLIHGRIADSVYPFTLLYDKTGDEKYLTAAKLVIDWAEYNVLREGNGYFNDKLNFWQGVSAFFAASLGDALLYHGECLDKETYHKWLAIFERTVEFVYDYFDRPTFHTVINYFAGECQLMALAYILLGKKKYKEKAYEKAEFVKTFFTEDGLLSGEGPFDIKTPKKCVCVDIGYNVEESLPALTVFAYLMKDEEYLKFCAEKFATHLEFMMPDGAWDNSWGSRAYKWTYWGSRTSDGAQSGLCILAKYNPVFAEAAQRNFELYEKCSLDGYLYGGRMYIEAGEEPCTHHSFCHAKALAAMIDTGFAYSQKTALPREMEYGVKSFPSVHVNLISKGDWRATISDDDAMQPGNRKTSSGGSVTLLWNKKTGPVFAATVPKYERSEPLNMQWSRHDDDMDCATLRISDNGYESVNDFAAVIDVKETEQGIEVVSKGHLKDTDFQPNGKFELAYLFQENRFSVTAKAENECVLKLPVICSHKDKVTVTNNKIEIERNGATITLSSEKPLELEQSVEKRRFHVIGGFETIGVVLKLSVGEVAGVTVEIQ